jgi:diadenosine tetraphosphatase ApaH/serine/threonine PP2A family protein phosphatase
MISPEHSRYLVIPDTHGEYEKTARAVDAHESEMDMFVFLGDIMGGPDSHGVIRIIRDLGDKALTIAGNREWACRNALTEGEDPLIEAWRSEIWPNYKHGMLLESYGLRVSRDWRYNAAQLREAMGEKGDLDWLNSLPSYVETDTFIAVHAGPELDKPWSEQARYLEDASRPERRLEEEPPQIYDRKLAAATTVPELVDSRNFVTGHDHPHNLPKERRVGPRKVRLSSGIGHGEPLFVWRSVDQTIHEY